MSTGITTMIASAPLPIYVSPPPLFGQVPYSFEAASFFRRLCPYWKITPPVAPTSGDSPHRLLTGRLAAISHKQGTLIIYPG